jgi:serine protease AprX
VIRAIEFAIANKDVLKIHVINLSLGHPIFEAAATDPLVQAVEHASRAGIMVVVSAGNFGRNRTTGEVGYAGIASPGNAPSGISVGSVQTFDTVLRDDDRIAPYSSRGPSWYDGFAKPDISAPGDDLLSVAAVGSKLRLAQEALGNRGNYMRLSGTSMATGVVSGLIALVLQNNENLTPNALKMVLQYSSIPVKTEDGTYFDVLTQGAGSVNANGAITLARAIDPLLAVGDKWLTADVTPSTIIGGQTYVWAQRMVWGNHIARGTGIIDEQRPAWALDTVWGDGLEDDDNIVWGNNDDDNIVWGNFLDDDDNIVWGNNVVWGNNQEDDDNIVWGNLGDDDNIVWGNFDDDNIVWGNNVVWGNALIALNDDDNIVWGNADDDNIVWGNLDDDNIVWGNSGLLGSVLTTSKKPGQAKKGVK